VNEFLEIEQFLWTIYFASIVQVRTHLRNEGGQSDGDSFAEELGIEGFEGGLILGVVNHGAQL
jgi:hypothetical protein